MKNTFFIYDSTIFVTAKARGIDAEREKVFFNNKFK